MAVQVALCHPGTGERVLHRDIGHDLAHRLVPVELAVLDQKAGRSRGKCLVDEPIAGSVSASTAASDRLSRRPAPSHRTALPSCPTWTAARTAPSVSNRVVAISRSSAASTWAVPAITSASPILEGPTGPGGRVALRFRCRRARQGAGGGATVRRRRPGRRQERGLDRAGPGVAFLPRPQRTGTRADRRPTASRRVTAIRTGIRTTGVSRRTLWARPRGSVASGTALTTLPPRRRRGAARWSGRGPRRWRPARRSCRASRRCAGRAVHGGRAGVAQHGHVVATLGLVGGRGAATSPAERSPPTSRRRRTSCRPSRAGLDHSNIVYRCPCLKGRNHRPRYQSQTTLSPN